MDVLDSPGTAVHTMTVVNCDTQTPGLCVCYLETIMCSNLYGVEVKEDGMLEVALLGHYCRPGRTSRGPDRDGQ